MTELESDRIRRLHDERLNTYWQKMLATEAGRAIAWELMEFCGLLRVSYTGNADTNFREGARNVALHFLGTRINPAGSDLFAKMFEEGQRRREEIEEAIQREQENEQ